MNVFSQQKFHQRIRFAIVGIALAAGALPQAALAGGGSLVQQWVARYNGPADGSDQANAVAVDSRDNVIVTGSSSSSTGVTIKYNSRGQQVWVKGGSSDQHVVVDADDNVYVTGSSATIKYDADGNLMWQSPTPGAALAVDLAGNVYVTGFSTAGTVKLDPSTGAQQWNNSTVQGMSVKLDYAGNVYVAGQSNTFKLDPSGGWATWSRPVGVSTRFALAVEANGNVYVTGTSGSTYVTAKYDTNGNQLWMKTRSDICYAIALDAAGNAYVLPRYITNVSKHDSATGNVLWTTNAGTWFGINLVVSSRGDVYVGAWDSSNFYTSKINSAGVAQSPPAIYDNKSNDKLLDIVLDSRGNPIVTGTSTAPMSNGGSAPDFATVKYSR